MLCTGKNNLVSRPNQGVHYKLGLLVNDYRAENLKKLSKHEVWGKKLLTEREGGWSLSTFYYWASHFENQSVTIAPPPRGGMGHFDFPIHFHNKITTKAKCFFSAPSTPVTFPRGLAPLPGGGGGP